MDEKVIETEKEYYWGEMWYNKDIDMDSILDIYNDMEWWLEYQLEDWQD